MVMFYGQRRGALPPSPWLNRVGLVVAAFVCVYGSYHDPSLPLSWLLIIPSVWGGLTLTVRGTGYLAHHGRPGRRLDVLPAAEPVRVRRRCFPASSIMDLLVIASTAFSLLLTLMREQRARADRRARPQGRRVGEPAPDARDRLRLDERRRRHRRQRPGLDVQRRRAAAARPSHPRRHARLLGRGLRAGRRRRSPARRRHPPRGALGRRRRRHPLQDAPGARSSNDGTARILDLSAQPIGTAEERSTMVLLHDVTAQRARLRELSNFAGMVAHDLRGPLTVLDGWLEVVEDGDPAKDAALVDDAAAQGPRVQPPHAPGDRGLAELHRRPERPAAARGDQAVRRRLRDRGRPPGALGRRRRAAVLPRPRPQRARRPGSAASAPRQPGRQRDQVHRADQQPWVQISSERRRRAGLDPRRRRRPRRRDPRGRGGADLRGVPPRPAGGALRRHRARARAHATHRRAARRLRCGRAATPRAARPSPSPCPRPEAAATSTGAGRLARPRCRAWRCSGAGRRPSSRRTSTTRRTTRAGGVRR